MSAPKSKYLKLISGTEKPCREREVMDVEVLKETPSPPHWMLNPDAIEEWNTLAPIFTANGLMTIANVSVLAQLCSLHGALVQSWKNGWVPHAATMGQYRSMVNDFGLTPVAMQKIKLPGENKKANAFAGNGKRA